MPARNRGLAWALGGFAAIALASLAAYRPLPVRAADAALEEFSALRAAGELRGLLDGGAPHPVGSAANAKVRERIVARLTALGWAVQLQRGTACQAGTCAMPVNIVATLAPWEALATQPAAAAVLLAAHYDSVPAGPGASDDLASTAAVLEIARILKARPAAAHPVVLLLSDGEEAGLLGATLFVREHPAARRIAAAVNLDARGTSGLSLMFETGSANTWLMRLYAAAVARPVSNSLYYAVYRLLPNSTDFTVFKAAGYQGYNFAYIGNVGRYHTPLDTFANASLKSLQQQGENALAVLTALSAARIPSGGGESVFLDVLGRGVVQWPAALSLPAALVMLVLIALEVRLLVQARAALYREIINSAGVMLGALGAAVLLCAALLAGLIALGKVPPLSAASWIAHPAPLHLAAAALALLAAWAGAAPLARTVTVWSAWSAIALLGALGGVAVAARLPGASFPLALSSLAALLAALPAARSALRVRVPGGALAEWASIAPALVLFAALIASLLFLYAALGSPAWPVSTGVLALNFLYLVPLFMLASARARRALGICAAAILAVAVGGALLLPSYSREWPKRMNVEYWFDADLNEAHYFVREESLPLPAAFQAAAPFKSAPHPRFTHSGVRGVMAIAPLLVLAAPELQVEADRPSQAPPAEPNPAARHLNLHLASARGAPQAMVVFPAEARVTSATFAGTSTPVTTALHPVHDGATLLEIMGLPAGGVSFGIDVRGAGPLLVKVMDESYTLAAGGELAALRPTTATSSQEGDVTVVTRTVVLLPAAGR